MKFTSYDAYMKLTNHREMKITWIASIQKAKSFNPTLKSGSKLLKYLHAKKSRHWFWHAWGMHDLMKLESLRTCQCENSCILYAGQIMKKKLVKCAGFVRTFCENSSHSFH